MCSSMTPTVRLVATDIDGTLANPAGQITDYTRRTFHALHARGVELALVTGLNPWMGRRYLDMLAPWVRAICLNGIFTLAHGQPVPGKYIDPQVASTAAACAHRLGATPIVFGADLVSRYLPGPVPAMDQVDRLIAERPFQPYAEVATLSELFSVAPAQVSICEDEARAAALYPHLLDALGDAAYVVFQPGDPSWVEVSHPEARKDLGLLALAHQLAIEPDQVLYFGDNLNDLPVFRRLPHTVAMANARPEIKALAWRETASNSADGVARFLAAHFGLSI